jgi:undecaprenyl-diphosphatase
MRSTFARGEAVGMTVHAHPRERFARRPADAITAAIASVVLVLVMVTVRDGTVSDPERAVFRAVNDLPAALYPVLWPFQQLGAVLVGPILAIVAFALRHVRLGVALLLATVAKLGLERVVKDIVTRPRPGTSIGRNIHARGTVSLHGPSFVSGHAVLVAALASVIAPYLRGRWRILPWVVVAVVMVTRVYVGAHNPLDVIGGAALGILIGGCLNLIVGVPEPDEPDVRTSPA